MKKNTKIIIITIICVISLIAIIGVSSFIYIKSTYISKDEVKEIVIDDTKLSARDISFKEIDLDLDGETKKYDVEFYYNRVEYNYEIDAKTGDIIYSNFINNNNNSNNNNNNNTANNDTNNNNNVDNNNSNNNGNSNNNISEEEAKNIALKDAGFNNSEVTFIKVELELENGRTIYEVDFLKNNIEYEYKIDAINKNIINKDKEFRD